jgi:HK97 family phage portal protein
MGLWSALETWFKSAPNVMPGGDVYTPMTPFGGYGNYGSYPWQPGTQLDFAQEAGDLGQNAIVAACLQWIGRTFPESPIRVVTEDLEGQREPVPRHPLTQLIRRPNPYYSGILLWQATLYSYNLDGNAYWLKFHKGENALGGIGELWWEPHTSIRPVWDSNGAEFISGYQVMRGGRWKTDPADLIPREDVIHFRNGIDPTNPRKGLSPLKSALREIYTDNEAANYTASVMRNMGVPGLVLSPKGDTTIDDPQGLKAAITAKFTGDRRGEALVMQGPTEVTTIGWSPDDMNLELLRNIPEERITALMGVPAIVIGMGSGLDKATFANYSESRAAAYESNIIPTQRALAEQLTIDLLPEFGTNDSEEVEFDTSRVQALQENQTELFTRLSDGYKNGWLKRSEARAHAGMNLDTDDADDIYITDLTPAQDTEIAQTPTPDPALVPLPGTLTPAVNGAKTTVAAAPVTPNGSKP